MFKITAIEPQKRKRDRYSIYLNGQFWLGVSASTLSELPLHEGLELEEDEKNALEEELRVLEALQRAYTYLAFRDRSEKEMHTKLVEKLFKDKDLRDDAKEKIVEETIKRLIKKGLLNDQEFAQQLTENALARRYSRRRAQQYLREKGLDDQLINDSIEATYSSDTEKDIVQKLLVKKRAYYQRLKPDANEYEINTKLQQHLAQKGFNWDTIKEAMKDE